MSVRPIALSTALLLALCASAAAAPGLVILVRHAEKEAAPAEDPGLTAAGQERAAELARVVAVLTANVPLRAIFSTTYQRTRQTAAPLAAASGVPVTASNDDPVPKVLAIRGGAVVIVGHSNTVPALIRALGGPAGVVIADSEYGHLYVLSNPGTPRATLASLGYGR